MKSKRKGKPVIWKRGKGKRDNVRDGKVVERKERSMSDVGDGKGGRVTDK